MENTWPSKGPCVKLVLCRCPSPNSNLTLWFEVGGNEKLFVDTREGRKGRKKERKKREKKGRKGRGSILQQGRGLLLPQLILI